MKRLLIPVLIFTSSSYAAGIQKWVDDNGQVHYGDSPPAKTQTESVRVSRPPSNPGKALPRFTGSQDDTSATANADEDTASAPPETSEEVAQKQCEQAKKDLSTLNRTSRVRLRMDDGTIRYMTDEEREERKKLSEEDIKQFCQ
ncbi:MAG: DUF4124 domain-containing protein [Gammaproteobacteria bacterium]|nr:DUF4124 domain-containing protein [Gammaproteobacteria bacterium]